MEYQNYIDQAVGLEAEMKRLENRKYQWSFQLMIDHLYAQADALTAHERASLIRSRD